MNIYWTYCDTVSQYTHQGFMLSLKWDSAVYQLNLNKAEKFKKL